MNASHGKKWWIFFGASLMILLVNIDATIVNLALAFIARDLHTGLAKIQWIINAYLLTTIVFFIIGGKLSDIFGPKRVFLTGTIFFGVASLIAGVSPNFSILIIGRLLQGIGFAFTLGLALLMIANSFPEKQRGFALGLAITITGLGQALGPTVGGIILEQLNWHWIFLINIPIVIISFVTIFLSFKSTRQEKAHEKVDFSGASLLGVAIIMLLLSLNILTYRHFNFTLLAIGLAISLLFFVLFYWKEIKTKYPLVDFRLFKVTDYTLSLSIRILGMYSLGAFLFFIPLYLQNILGFSPLAAGLTILVYSALFAIASPITGVYCDRVGYKIPILISGCINVLALVTLALIGVHSTIFILLIGLLLFGMGTGIMIPATVHSTLSSLPPASAGEGIGVFFMIAMLGLSLGVAISGVQMNFVSGYDLMISHQALLGTLSQSTLALMHHVANGTQPISSLKTHLSHDNYQLAASLARQSFTGGLSAIMWTNAFLALIATGISLVLKKRASPSEHEA